MVNLLLGHLIGVCDGGRIKVGCQAFTRIQNTFDRHMRTGECCLYVALQVALVSRCSAGGRVVVGSNCCRPAQYSRYVCLPVLVWRCSVGGSAVVWSTFCEATSLVPMLLLRPNTLFAFLHIFIMPGAALQVAEWQYGQPAVGPPYWRHCCSASCRCCSSSRDC
jgi:hypothetical protein